MDSFSTTQGTFGTKEFLQSDSLVAKLAFLLVVIFSLPSNKRDEIVKLLTLIEFLLI